MVCAETPPRADTAVCEAGAVGCSIVTGLPSQSSRHETKSCVLTGAVPVIVASCQQQQGTAHFPSGEAAITKPELAWWQLAMELETLALHITLCYHYVMNV